MNNIIVKVLYEPKTKGVNDYKYKYVKGNTNENEMMKNIVTLEKYIDTYFPGVHCIKCYLYHENYYFMFYYEELKEYIEFKNFKKFLKQKGYV